ncbi:rod shape-determining protein RodA [Bacteroidia bacterium]|nr:rod shape-determining protein RodA [Bacteroidia bacterium]
MPSKNIRKSIDTPLVLLYLFFVVAGWLNIFSTSYMPENYSFLSSIAYKQMIYIGIALVLALMVLLLDNYFFINFAQIFFAMSVLLLILVLIPGIGSKISGARSWFNFGGFSFQPSEFAKFATCLMMAKYLSISNVSMTKFNNLFVAFLILILPVGLILLQPDAGSAIIFVSFLLAMYREGISVWFLWAIFAAILIFILALLLNFYIVVGIIVSVAIILVLLNKRSGRNVFLAIVFCGIASGFAYISNYAFEKLEQHQKDRINILLGKEFDTQTIGYNVNQAKIAIGAGGIVGKGYMQGTQTRFNFVPEQNTDFIFCTVGEEWGFLGCTIVMIMFILFIRRIIIIAERQYDTFTKIYGYCIAGFFFFHVLINIGMVIGLLPVIGVPLPFFSYGGSSLICFTLMLFVFIKQDAERIRI